MLRFLKRGAWELGHLEARVMEILWQQGERSVRDVGRSLGRHLAYTTVMTTLDRLFKKGLLNRRKPERAFLYSPRLSSLEFERREAGDFLAGFLHGSPASRELLISCLVDAVGQYDEALFEELERKINNKREELGQRRIP